MQINPVKQSADSNLLISNNSVKDENRATINNQKKPLEEAQDQIEIKDGEKAGNPQVINDTSLKFSRDQQTNQLIVELVNNQTGESVRQIPSEVSLKLSAIHAKMQGALVDENY